MKVHSLLKTRVAFGPFEFFNGQYVIHCKHSPESVSVLYRNTSLKHLILVCNKQTSVMAQTVKNLHAV